MAFIRRVKTASGATAVQIVRKEHSKVVEIKHVGSAHGVRELKKLEKQARGLIYENQPSLFDKETKKAIKAQDKSI